jgi:DUF1680 family protein
MALFTMLTSLAPGQVRLLPSLFQQRQGLNLKYILSLDSQNLLRPYLHEAALWSYSGSVGTTVSDTTADGPETWHWGWESLTCALRGHILGHWLSASAHLIAQTQNGELRAKADAIVSELARCQDANGGGWCGPFPESFMVRLAAGNPPWAPQYVLHKLLAGLFDMSQIAGNETALTILLHFAEWFDRWTTPMTPEQLDDVLDFETGGMLEVWANLYGVTGDEKHRALIDRYYRRRFFDRLLDGEDVLTNKHANTQIPEILGAARAFEVTGEERFRRITEAFWKAAVTERGTYCTGGGTCGEVWQPPFALASRLHAPHEHCTVYNMMRLSDYLFRWTGNKAYADYWEHNYLNAILAQQNPDTGMVSYFLPLGGESKKTWGRPLHDFWCCHGTLMQAHAHPQDSILFEDGNALVLSQYLPFETQWKGVKIALSPDVQQGVSIGQRFSPAGHQAIQVYDVPIPPHRPEAFVYDLRIEGAADSGEVDFEFRLRVPDWLCEAPRVLKNGEDQPLDIANGFLRLRCVGKTTWRLIFPKALTVQPLPDAPDTVAFLDGPLVLAGLVGEERTLVGDPSRPETLLQSDAERHHGWWHTGTYRTRGQERGFRFVPLCEVKDETYCVYFPVRTAVR